MKNKTTPKRILKLFDVKAGVVVRTENYARWISELALLSFFDYEEIKREYQCVALGFPGKTVFYYIGAVRRNLDLKKHESFKRQKEIPSVMKKIMKGIGGGE